MKLSVLLLIPIAGLVAIIHFAFSFIVATLIGCLLVATTSLESELMESGHIQLDKNGGSQTGNKLAKILAILLVLVIVLPLIVKVVFDT